jgi:glycerol uptake facilitator-like aquaporin
MMQKVSAEFIGTLWLVLGGCGSAVLAAAFPDVGIGLLGVSFAFGLSVLTMAYAVGPISGGHGGSRPASCCPTSWRRLLVRLPGRLSFS